MEVVELPGGFEDADTDHLVLLIADMLQRLIVHNDRVPLTPEGLTRFHSRTPPSISVLEYLRRIVKYTKVEKSCLLITLHYIDIICARFPKFTISSLTVHRFLIASIAVASKALCDVFCKNSHYAKVGGTRVEELNLLEREFLSFIDWRLTCTREVLQAYYTNLVRTHSTGMFKIIEPDPVSGDEATSRENSPESSEPQEAADEDISDSVVSSPFVGPSSMLGVIKTADEVPQPPIQQRATLEQTAAFEALRKPESPCAVEAIRGEKRRNSQVFDPVSVDSRRRRIDDGLTYMPPPLRT